MAANTLDAVKTQDQHPVDSDSEDDDPEDKTPADAKELYITKRSQICYDRVLPRDLNTTQKSTAPTGLGGLLRASGDRRKIWHKKTLNVCFVESSPREDEILELARTWSKYCGIEFKKVTSRYGSDIRIGFHEDDGAWSYVGTDCAEIPLNELTMNLGFIDRATVLHEFGHALGLIHEHQSPAQGGFNWNRPVVIEDLKGPPNYWDMDTIKSNIFFRYKKTKVSGTKYDKKSIMHYSFPPEWIKGNKFPHGIPYNYKLSKLDKKLVRKFYGPPRAAEETKDKAPVDKSDAAFVPSIPVPVENKQLPGPSNTTAFAVPVLEPHKGVLKSSDDEVLVTFHTSTDEEPKLYTIVTHGDMDTMISLLGPNDPEKFITADDNSGECKNAKVERVLFPDSDYYVLIRTFDPDGGEFQLFITAT